MPAIGSWRSSAARPRLIAYDTDLNIKARSEGKPQTFRLIRWRTSLYAAIIAIAGGIMIFTLATRDSEGISVIHDRNPMFVRLSDGSLRNAYTIRIVNKQLKSRDFILSVDGIPSTLIDYRRLAAARRRPSVDHRRPRPDQGSARHGHRLQFNAAGAIDHRAVHLDRHRFRRHRADARPFLRTLSEDIMQKINEATRTHRPRRAVLAHRLLRPDFHRQWGDGEGRDFDLRRA